MFSILFSLPPFLSLMGYWIRYWNRREKGRERGLNGNEMDSIPLFQTHPLSSFTHSINSIQNE